MITLLVGLRLVRRLVGQVDEENLYNGYRFLPEIIYPTICPYSGSLS